MVREGALLRERVSSLCIFNYNLYKGIRESKEFGLAPALKIKQEWLFSCWLHYFLLTFEPLHSQDTTKQAHTQVTKLHRIMRLEGGLTNH